MIMGSYDKNWCQRTLNEMYKWHLTSIFRNPVDPVRDGAPNYFEKVKKPIDLSTIKKKLVSDEYKSPQEFVDDVNLIYENSFLYNGENSIITYIAKDISNWIHEKFKNKASSQEEEWERDLKKSIEQLNEHMMLKPPPEISQAVTNIEIYDESSGSAEESTNEESESDKETIQENPDTVKDDIKE